jgi:hypothetical protein
MRLQGMLTSVGLALALAAHNARAGDLLPVAVQPNCPPACPPSTSTLPGTGLPTEPGQAPAAPAPGDAASSFAQSPEAGSGESRGFTPNMFGDFPSINQLVGTPTATFNGMTQSLPRGVPITQTFPRGTVFNFDVFVGNQFVPAGTPIPTNSGTTPFVIPRSSQLTGTGVAALVGRGAFKIADNESPRPQDRVYLNYNYFNDVNPALNAQGFPREDVHREVIGFEKTFLDGNASFGMRLPYVQVLGDGSVRRSDLGDLTLVGKYAIINDCNTGNVLSAGLAVTLPTGSNFLPAGEPDIHSTLIQPYVGAIYNMGNFYVQGFSSIFIPTDERDVTFMSNDIGLGYRLYQSNCRDQLIQYVTPTLEAHLNTPFNHRGSLSQPIGLQDIFDLTYAASIGIGKSSNLGIGIVTPLTGPKPFDFEGQVYFNWRF